MGMRGRGTLYDRVHVCVKLLVAPGDLAEGGRLHFGGWLPAMMGKLRDEAARDLPQMPLIRHYDLFRSLLLLVAARRARALAELL